MPALPNARILHLQGAFWFPLLQYAREHHDPRTDRTLDDIVELIIFLQFLLVTGGISFSMSREQMCDRIDTCLIPALCGWPHASVHPVDRPGEVALTRPDFL